MLIDIVYDKDYGIVSLCEKHTGVVGFEIVINAFRVWLFDKFRTGEPRGASGADSFLQWPTHSADQRRGRAGPAAHIDTVS